MTGQSGEGTPGQVGPKPQGTGKFKQDGEREKFSSRLHREGSPKETEAAKEERADAKADTHQKKRADAGKVLFFRLKEHSICRLFFSKRSSV